MRGLLAMAYAILFAASSSAVAQQTAPLTGMVLTSPDFADGGVIPDKFTQASTAPVSPALQWDNVPANTQSFALIFHDVDVAIKKAPTDNLHWLAFNIPAAARSLPQAVPQTPQLPDGTIQGLNGAGAVGYRGPGARAPGPYHHYVFELYALDTTLNLGPTATRTDVIAAMEGHVIGKASDTGRFHR